MKMIRFEDSHGNPRWGRRYDGHRAELLEGSPLEGLRDTGATATVRRLLAPVPPVPVIFGIGLNYRRHAAETGRPIPRSPVVFGKSPGSVVGPGAAIEIHRSCMDPPQVDYEVELAVVIGRRGRDVPRESALEHVLGYTVANDVSARRWQKKAGGQWTRGKSFDTFCPLGPCLVTPDELGEAADLRLTTRLNGRIVQDSRTSDLIFGVTELVAHLSAGTTLLPGTVILTGTPEGVGFVREPPLYLQPGDVVEMEIEGIGALRNPVREMPLPQP